MKSSEVISQDHFPHISQERGFSRTLGLRRKMDNNKTLRFRPFPAKTNDTILRKSPKTYFWRKPPNWVGTGFLLKIRALELFLHLLSPNFIQNIRRKTNEPILRKRPCVERTNKRTNGRI